MQNAFGVGLRGDGVGKDGEVASFCESVNARRGRKSVAVQAHTRSLRAFADDEDDFGRACIVFKHGLSLSLLSSFASSAACKFAVFWALKARLRLSGWRRVAVCVLARGRGLFWQNFAGL